MRGRLGLTSPDVGKVPSWFAVLALLLTAGDPTLADAILDRLVHNAHRLTLGGSSMGRRQPPLTTPTSIDQGEVMLHT